jgi:hypothetical protein
MTSEYLLPCSCGRTNRVSVRQAGETVECAGCASKLDVPPMRELRRLEPVAAEAARPKAAWGTRQGLFFVGLLTLVLSLVVCGVFYFFVMPGPTKFMPTQAQLDNTRPGDAWRYWAAVRQGIPMNPTNEVVVVLQRTRLARLGIRVTLGLAVFGLALSASGLLFKSKKV